MTSTNNTREPGSLTKRRLGIAGIGIAVIGGCVFLIQRPHDIPAESDKIASTRSQEAPASSTTGASRRDRPHAGSDLPTLDQLRQELANAPLELKAMARTRLAIYYAEHDPEEGFRWLQSLDKSEDIHSTIETFGTLLAKSDAKSWKTFLNRFEDPNEKRSFLRGAITGLAVNDAGAAITLLDQQNSSIQDLDNFRTQVISRVAQFNPEQLAAVLDLNVGHNADDFSQGAIFENQATAIRTFSVIKDERQLGDCLYRYIRGIEGQKLLDFATALSSSPLSDLIKSEGLASAVEQQYTSNPGVAATYVKQIPDSDLRAKMIEKIRNRANTLGPAARQKVEAILAK